MPREKKQRLEDVPIKSDAEKLAEIRAAFLEALTPSEYLDLDEWADRYRILPTETSSESGQWSTARFPFLRKIMKCLSPASAARSIVVIKGSQLGFTEVSINWILYTADVHPGPMLYAQATEQAAEDFSKQKLAPSIAACPAVRYSLGEGKARGLSDTILDKGFPGGYIAIGPANSEKFTRSKSVRDAIADEEDSYNADSDGAGAPIKNIQKRQVNFADRKIFRLSTPKIKETSTIQPAYEFGSQEQYYVSCPHCNPHAYENGFRFVIKWDDIRWSKEVDKKTGLPTSIWLECPGCGEKITEDKKTWMMAEGHADWYSVKGADTRYKVDDKTENRSFHISSLYSPYGFFSWADAVSEWFEYRATNDRNLLQVFINQTLGECFTLEGQEISYHHLASRGEEYGASYGYDVPRGGLVLTCGVDVQDDRIECNTIAWGLYDEHWHTEYTVIPGDTLQMGDHSGMTADGQPSVWLLLDQYLAKRFRHQSGQDMPIEVTMIDAGHRTEQVHTFCRLREGRRIFPVKGKDGWGLGLWQVSRKRHERFGTFLYTAFVDEVKNKIYGMLQISQPGPGFVHFPKIPCYGEAFFKGLVCESRKAKMVNGKLKLQWVTPPGARNEPLDCTNYAFIARQVYPVNLAERAAALGLPVAAPPGQVVHSAPQVRKRRGSPGL